MQNLYVALLYRNDMYTEYMHNNVRLKITTEIKMSAFICMIQICMTWSLHTWFLH